jgi:hypothetical protein
MKHWLFTPRLPIAVLAVCGYTLSTPILGAQLAPPPAQPSDLAQSANGGGKSGPPQSVEPASPSDPFAGTTLQQDLSHFVAESKRAAAEASRKMSGLRFGLNGPAANRLLVIPGKGDNAASVGQTRTELAIMSRILSKAGNPESSARGNFRFDFGGLGFGDRRELDALYLDGYGAVFLLDVDYPLVAPPKVALSNNRETNGTDTAWEIAKREVAGLPTDEARAGGGGFGGGQSPGFGGGRAFAGGGGFGGSFPAQADVEYQADRVKRLTDRIIAALRHAANIKSLGPNDKVVVHVHGRPSRTYLAESAEKVQEEQRKLMGGGMATDPSLAMGTSIHGIESSGSEAPRVGTSLNLEVPASAIADVAEARITRDEFAKRVRVTARDDGRDDK